MFFSLDHGLNRPTRRNISAEDRLVGLSECRRRSSGRNPRPNASLLPGIHRYLADTDHAHVYRVPSASVSLLIEDKSHLIPLPTIYTSVLYTDDNDDDDIRSRNVPWGGPVRSNVYPLSVTYVYADQPSVYHQHTPLRQFSPVFRRGRETQKKN